MPERLKTALQPAQRAGQGCGWQHQRLSGDWLEALSARLVQATPESVSAMQGLKRRHAEYNAEVRRLSKDLQRMKRRAREHVGRMKIREPQLSIARALVCMNNGETTSAVLEAVRLRTWMLIRKGSWTKSCGTGGEVQMSTHGRRTWWWIRLMLRCTRPSPTPGASLLILLWRRGWRFRMCRRASIRPQASSCCRPML